MCLILFYINFFSPFLQHVHFDTVYDDVYECAQSVTCT